MGGYRFYRIGDSVSFISYNEHKGRRNIISAVERISVQLGGKDGIILFPEFKESGRKAFRKSKRHPEDTSHCCTKNFRGENIHTIRAQKQSIKACGISRPDHRTHISRILNTIQRKKMCAGNGKDATGKDGGNTLWCSGIADRLKDM